MIKLAKKLRTSKEYCHLEFVFQARNFELSSSLTLTLKILDFQGFAKLKHSIICKKFAANPIWYFIFVVRLKNCLRMP